LRDRRKIIDAFYTQQRSIWRKRSGGRGRNLAREFIRSHVIFAEMGIG
jgi:hypothetical protein